MHRRRALSVALAGAYLLALALIALWPSHVDEDLDIVGSGPARLMIEHLNLSASQAYDSIEFAANVLLFVPLGVLTLTALPRQRWVRGVALAAAASIAIELAQTIALPERTASWRDIIANSTGGAIGVLTVAIWRAATRRRATAAT
jgi:VanZ family protein